jgi:hypothetical protein
MLAAYDIHELVAQSSECVIFAGEEKEAGAAVAMRRYLARRDGERRAEDVVAFQREAGKYLGIEEPRVVGILEAGFDPQDHHPFFVTRTLVGEALPKMLNGALLAESDALGVVNQALDGLEFLHQRGLVHGGLRSDRLVWSTTQGVCLMDAGVEPALIMLGDYAAAGEPATTAPELRGGGGRAVAGDFYALGACLFELLSGAPIPTDGRPRPSVGDGSLARWNQWLDAMCAEDPGARPADVAQAHELLTAALAIIPMRKQAPAKPAPLARAAGPVKAPQSIMAPGRAAGPDSSAAAIAALPSSGGPRKLAVPAGKALAVAGAPRQLVPAAPAGFPPAAAPVGARPRKVTRRAAIAVVVAIAAATGIFLVTRSGPESPTLASAAAHPTPPPAPTRAAPPPPPARETTPDRPPVKPPVAPPTPAAQPLGHGNAPRYIVKRTPDMRELVKRPDGEPANLVGTVKAVTLSRSGKFIDIVFSDVRARGFMKIDPAAANQATLVQLEERILGKNISVFGTVERRDPEERNPNIGVRFSNPDAITIEP